MVENIDTNRLRLIAATPHLLRAELADLAELSAALGVARPAEWPPSGSEYDEGAIQFFLTQLSAGGEQAAGWYTWYAVLKPALPSTLTESAYAQLIGNGGFFGPPDETGTVEIGYSVCEGWRGKGFGAEIVRGLLARAWRSDAVNRVVARTRPDNLPSVNLLRSNGFRLIASSDPPDMLLFELLRAFA